MPRKPTDKAAPPVTDPDVPSTANDKQKDRRYYYDDAHGYEDFDPKSEADEDDDEEVA